MEEWCVLPAQAFFMSHREQQDQGTEQMLGLPIAIGTSDTHGEENSQRRCLPPLDLSKGRVTQSHQKQVPWDRDVSCHKDVGHLQ